MLEQYQEKALEVELFHDEISPEVAELLYLYAGLTEEVGEIGSKLKRIIRDSNCKLHEEDIPGLKKECGDTLWYLTALISKLGLTLDEVAEDNLRKIQSRIERDVLRGVGDSR